MNHAGSWAPIGSAAAQKEKKKRKQKRSGRKIVVNSTGKKVTLPWVNYWELYIDYLGNGKKGRDSVAVGRVRVGEPIGINAGSSTRSRSQ